MRGRSPFIPDSKDWEEKGGDVTNHSPGALHQEAEEQIGRGVSPLILPGFFRDWLLLGKRGGIASAVLLYIRNQAFLLSSPDRISSGIKIRPKSNFRE